MLRRLPPLVDPRVLVATATRDDAGVYLLDARTALVFTTDFFTPIVDDPRDFGAIAAANALSDVYAMGARPLIALNLLAFPRSLGLKIAGRIVEGGASVCEEAGVSVVGGHSIDDAEPKFGLAVLGLVHPKKIVSNAGARPGDRLILTKPLGSGIIATAIKRGKARPAEIREITRLMRTLNRAASEVACRYPRGVRAMTDVTGFGLLGHLLEMLEASQVGAELCLGAVPVLPAARRHAEAGAIPGGSKANLEAVARKVRFEQIDPLDRLLLADAQTSGGLLISASPRVARRLVARLEAANTLAAAIIGTVVEGAARITVRP